MWGGLRGAQDRGPAGGADKAWFCGLNGNTVETQGCNRGTELGHGNPLRSLQTYNCSQIRGSVTPTAKGCTAGGGGQGLLGPIPAPVAREGPGPPRGHSGTATGRIRGVLIWVPGPRAPPQRGRTHEGPSRGQRRGLQLPGGTCKDTHVLPQLGPWFQKGPGPGPPSKGRGQGGPSSGRQHPHAASELMASLQPDHQAARPLGPHPCATAALADPSPTPCTLPAGLT